MELELEQLVRQNILKLKPYSSARSEYKGQADVFLDANENPFNNGLNRYPDPLQKAVKEEITRVKQVKADQIFLGNGSDEAIDLLIRIFCEPGQDHILLLPPTYGMYQVSADISAVETRAIPLTPDFQPNVSAILEQMNPQSKLLFLCSPNNPTGNQFEEEKVLEILENFSGITVIDEAYIDFSSQASATQWLHRFPKLVVMQTFSKAWGLAGIRLGMAFANPPLIGLMNKVKPPYNINHLSQQAALEALQKDDQKQEWVQCILEERSRLVDVFKDFPFVEVVYPSDANFILVKVDHAKAVYDYLIQQKIIVRDRSKVLLCDECLRVSVGTVQENNRLLAALAAYPSVITNV